MKKRCSKCKELKDLDCFHKQKNGMYGVRSKCVTCRSVEHMVRVSMSCSMFKTCTRCFEEKSIHCFYRRRCGVKSICHECSNLEGVLYRRKKAGCIKTLYSGMVGRCKNSTYYVNRSVNFSLDEFKKFIETSCFLNVYNAWVDSGYKSTNAPSVDRINNCKGYNIDNIQILTRGKNSKKSNK